jgi:hypothetical protein
MSVRHFIGGAPLIQQVHEYTVTDVTNTLTYIGTLTNLNSNGTDGETLYTNGGAETTTTVATGLAAAINRSANGLFNFLSATSNGAVLTVRSAIAGMPFSLAWTGTATAPTLNIVTRNSGPSDFSCEGNWSEGAIAGGGDDIIFCATANVLYNLYKSATTFGKLSTSLNFTGQVGIPGTPFKGTCTGLDVNGAGIGHFDINASAIVVNVRGSKPQPANAPGVTIIGSAIVDVNNFGTASTAIAPYAGQTSAISDDVTVYGGVVTIGGATTVGGEVIVQAGTANILSTAVVDQLDVYGGGSAFVDPQADVTAANNHGGKLMYDRASGAITTLTEYGGQVTAQGPQS